jgi:TonB family protein
MGYQALLFCPDEKTARTVTQVLSELDFAVVSCTEPFAAVKKLMGEHFDAVVVDCDNEQNATLLFKSARNAPNNQSALAVAVVEGQAGVAKAFRIGANLVLTKPINVEQAKGTLRVARGLLRKNEIAKPAGTAVKPAASTPPARPTQVMPIVTSSRPMAPSAPVVATKIPAPKSTPQTSFAATASSQTSSNQTSEVAESGELGNAVPKQVPSPSITTSKAQTSAAKIAPPAATEPEPEIALSTPEVAAPTTKTAGFSVGPSAGSASAAAPARVAKTTSSAEAKAPAAIPEDQIPFEKAAISASSSTVEQTSPAPSFTFGGAIESEEKSEGGGSKKALLAVAAVLLIAAGGYAAWIQFGPSILGMHAPAAEVARPAANPVVVPQASTTVAPSSADSSAASVPSAVTSAIPSSTTVQPAATAKPLSSGQNIPGANNGQSHPSKTNPESESSKPEESDVTVNKAPGAVAKPIVIKNGVAQRVAASSAAANDAAAPSIASIAPAGNGGSLPNLMDGASGAPTPVLQTMNVSQGVSQGLILKKIAPSYPTTALRLRVEGPVELLATITKKGDISGVKILSGDPTLARAAVDAVKQWKYKPYLLDGSPVEIQTQITVNFKLPR